MAEFKLKYRPESYQEFQIYPTKSIIIDRKFGIIFSSDPFI